MQLRAGRARDAVHGPRPALLGEGVVVGGMPVARGDHQVVVAGRGQRVDAVGDLVAVRDGQAPPGVKSFWKSTITRALAIGP